MDKRNADPEQALQRFVGDNADLERLEAILSEFNIFEAVGVSRQELRHSDFLSYLLTPSKSHGLGDYFVKRLLHRVVAESTVPLSFSSIDVDIWQFHDMEVRREWHNIDLLLLSPSNRLAVVIENKVDAREHSDQLSKYRMTASRLFPGWHHGFVFLSRFGGAPSDQSYVAVGYADVAHILEHTLVSRGTLLDTPIRVAIEHYIKLLRRHVVEDSQIAELCRRIYQRHRQAIDLILEHRLSTRDELYSYLMEMLAADGRFVEDGSTSQYVRFALPEWDSNAMKSGHSWTPSGRMLLLEFTNNADSLTFGLLVGPGRKDVRDVLVEQARTGPEPFAPPRRMTRWIHLLGLQVLGPQDYEVESLETLKERIDAWWDQFLKTSLPIIQETMIPAINRLRDLEIESTIGHDDQEPSPRALGEA